MAKSRFEYVREFELPDRCLPGCWMVVRIDGKGFHKFSDQHGFKKPNDERALRLMTRCAEEVMNQFGDVVLAYGQSDEYSFVFRRGAETYNRRASKLMTTISSLFASSYVFHWSEHFGQDVKLKYAPAFDGRVVLYPTNQNLRDYLSWRQADCHINNLHNTCYWSLIQESGLSAHDAMTRLKGTVSADKNELLFTDFNINYNDLPQLYRKGTTLVYEAVEASGDTSPAGKIGEDSAPSTEILSTQTSEAATAAAGALASEDTEQQKQTKNVRKRKRDKNPPQQKQIVALHVDIIGNEFWEKHPDILDGK